MQIRIALALTDEPICGVHLIHRLNIKRPGTKNPVLNTLHQKSLIDFHLETEGSVRKKTYFLTDNGLTHLREQLADWSTCCMKCSSIPQRIIKTFKELFVIKNTDTIFITFKDSEIQHYFEGAKIFYSNKENMEPNSFDVIINFLGVGFLWGKGFSDLTSYIKILYQSLHDNGQLITVEFEKSNNILAQILFVDIFGMQETAGLDSKTLTEIFVKTGFKNVTVTARDGLLYAIGNKNAVGDSKK